MINWWLLAQVTPWDEAPAAPAAARKPMNFQDLQRGFQQWNSGDTDTFGRNGLLLMVAVVAVLALLIHLRARVRGGKTPDSERKLFRQLARVAGLSLTTRWLLRWVAAHAQVHAATLLVSPTAFQVCVDRWSKEPSFVALRIWGHRRLTELQPKLFT